MNIIYRADFQQYSPNCIGMKWAKSEMGMQTPRLFYSDELYFTILKLLGPKFWDIGKTESELW